jgi:GTP diphosphokinase / guanosine-3',5'-bis(diphosphate) 3'-diphosphatase
MPEPAPLESARLILEAASFAARAHAAQKRKGAAGEPYVNHALEVARLVAAALPAPDTNLVIAALLHDTVEDTAVTPEEIAARFGEDVSTLVSELTDDKSLPRAERKRLQVENAPRKSPRAQMVKIADKISNVRAILESPPAGWSEERRREYIAWARQVVAALSAPNPVLKAEFESLAGSV